MKDSGLDKILRKKIVPYIREDAWFREAALDRVASEMTELREDMDRFDEQRFSIVADLARLLGRYPRTIAKINAIDRTRALRELARKAKYLKKVLLESYRHFLRNSYRRYLPIENPFFVEEDEVKHMRGVLIERFESVIEPDIKKLLEMMRDLIDGLDRLTEEDD